MKISATLPIAFASLFSCASLFSQDVDPNTYYFSGSDKNNVLTSRNAWTLSDGSKLGDDAPCRPKIRISYGTRPDTT